eukprot:TRINITY_DN10320_c0_g3_i1.p1 TRINITY_DN10320_c0_g3~~TRINITY_DN10320_c0_g3_i1.p1  ORF type:complete len:503 (-),score=192.07 TRINITY_DN10320_c0_g3_i1:72-1580(-)
MAVVSERQQGKRKPQGDAAAKASAKKAKAVAAAAALEDAEAAFDFWDDHDSTAAVSAEVVVKKKKDATAASKEASDQAAAPKKVKLKKSIAERIKAINVEANLPAPLKLARVADPLASLSEEQALELLDTLLEAREEDEDPTVWVCRAVKERHEWNSYEAEEWNKWEDEQEKGASQRFSLDASVRDRVRELNRSDKLQEPLRMTWVAGPLSLLRPKDALHILGILDRAGKDIERPSSFVKSLSLRRTTEVMARVDELNKGGAGRMDLIEPLDPAKVREPLLTLPDKVAMQMLQELEEKAMDIENPTSWVLEVVAKHATNWATTPIAKAIKELNDGGKLAAPIKVQEAMEALAEIQDDKVALEILGVLKRRAAHLRDPMSFIKAQAARRMSPALLKAKWLREKEAREEKEQAKAAAAEMRKAEKTKIKPQVKKEEVWNDDAEEPVGESAGGDAEAAWNWEEEDEPVQEEDLVEDTVATEVPKQKDAEADDAGDGLDYADGEDD